ncbi:hypothetical protein FB45DRAFT_1062551 [Roridomyces roridus]|uniref:Uncharacterized protein n=1 Tax=Roridomyces roridus TaxID=1738132 RepID=A0AAD7BG28_9AGAR|nr:hypothetical protein FB45DRAFT_1062551 [Roridomyces roridus]
MARSVEYVFENREGSPLFHIPFPLRSFDDIPGDVKVIFRNLGGNPIFHVGGAEVGLPPEKVQTYYSTVEAVLAVRNRVVEPDDRVVVKDEYQSPRIPSAAKGKQKQKKASQGPAPTSQDISDAHKEPTPPRPPRQISEEEIFARTIISADVLQESWVYGSREFALLCDPTQPDDRPLAPDEHAAWDAVWQKVLKLNRAFSGPLQGAEIDNDALVKRKDEMMEEAVRRLVEQRAQAQGLPVLAPETADEIVPSSNPNSVDPNASASQEQQPPVQNDVEQIVASTRDVLGPLHHHMLGGASQDSPATPAFGQTTTGDNTRTPSVSANGTAEQQPRRLADQVAEYASWVKGVGATPAGMQRPPGAMGKQKENSFDGTEVGVGKGKSKKRDVSMVREEGEEDATGTSKRRRVNADETPSSPNVTKRAARTARRASRVGIVVPAVSSHLGDDSPSTTHRRTAKQARRDAGQLPSSDEEKHLVGLAEYATMSQQLVLRKARAGARQDVRALPSFVPPAKEDLDLDVSERVTVSYREPSVRRTASAETRTQANAKALMDVVADGAPIPQPVVPRTASTETRSQGDAAAVSSNSNADASSSKLTARPALIYKHKAQTTFTPEWEPYQAWVSVSVSVEGEEGSTSTSSALALEKAGYPPPVIVLNATERAWLAKQGDLERQPDWFRPVNWFALGARMYRVATANAEEGPSDGKGKVGIRVDHESGIRPLHHGVLSRAWDRGEWRFEGHEEVGRADVPWEKWVRSEEGRRWREG